MSAIPASDRSAASLALRLAPPALPLELVERAEIDTQLRAARNVSLVLFCAPAGFGKTTAMTRYFERQRSNGIAAVWILLDDADNDVERFLFKMQAALDRSGLGDETPPGTSGVMAPGARFDVPARLASAQRPFAIFFDDFELLRNPVVLDLFKEALESLPAHGQAVLGAREHSRLNVGRWRATGRMVEIGLASLRFSATEARELLAQKSGVSLPQQALDQLYDRTEGWVAALQLAALTLKRHPDPSAFAWTFSGSNAAVADYLLETVISGLSPSSRDFLLATGILDELNADLCNALTGRRDSQGLLDELERSNVFLAPIDDDRRRYRYHALFADFLRSQLARSHPGKARELNLAASAWFAAEGRPVPAINHALASGDFRHTIGLLEVHAEHMLLEGRFRLLSRWLDGLPAELVEARPKLALVHACALALTRRQQQALCLLDSVESSAALATSSDAEGAALRNRVGALRGLALAMMDRSEECLQVCLRQCGSPDHSVELPVAMLTNALASALINATRFDEAMVVLTAAKRRHAASGSAFNMAIAECVHAQLEVMLGHLPDAIARLRGAMSSITQNRYRAIGGSAALGVGLSAALYHNDQLTEANHLLTECLPLTKEVGPPDSLIINQLLLARCARAMGDTELSLRRLADLELFGHSSSLPRLVATVWLERSRWALIDGANDAAHEYLRQAASFTDVWEQAKRFPANANDIDDLAMATIRFLVRTGRGAEALSVLKAEIATAEASRRRTRAALLKLLQAEAMMAEGQSRPALRQMTDVIKWAATGGYVRLFVDEGTAIAPLLVKARPVGAASDPKLSKQIAFVDQVFKSMKWSGPATVADQPTDSTGQAVFVEPLSGRELDVLRMLDLGCSNKSIAERLFISANTVKIHLRNINAKLSVGSRTQAVSAARRFGIIS